MVEVTLKRKEAEAALGVKLPKGRLRYPGELTHEQFKTVTEKWLWRSIIPEHTAHGMYALLDGLEKRFPDSHNDSWVFGGSYEAFITARRRMSRNKFEKWLWNAHKKGMRLATDRKAEQERGPAGGEQRYSRGSTILEGTSKTSYDERGLRRHPEWAWLRKKRN